MVKTNQSVYRDSEGSYIWTPSSQDRRKPYIKMYIPEEDPLDGAKTRLSDGEGEKTFIYNKEKDRWSEVASVEDRK